MTEYIPVHLLGRVGGNIKRGGGNHTPRIESPARTGKPRRAAQACEKARRARTGSSPLSALSARAGNERDFRRGAQRRRPNRIISPSGGKGGTIGRVLIASQGGYNPTSKAQLRKMTYFVEPAARRLRGGRASGRFS